MNKFNKNLCHVTFSHSDCSDVWPIYFGQMKKYFNVGLDHYICTESESITLPHGKKNLVYSDKDPYPARLLTCLEKLECEFIFFDHEDMFLYSMPDINELCRYYNLIEKGEFDHIRLIKGGKYKSFSVDGFDSLEGFRINSKWIFSIQPSFWRVSILKDILRKNIDCNIWELEERSQKVVKKMNLKAAFSHKSGKRRGLYHFDNSVYPYIATAIVKGKWNLSEYGIELGDILDFYDVDPTKRGWW